ncbi:MAG TPA: flagellar biosynthetic protein FliR [Mycobacteriales bacterium]|nr:flagellar biosynthetic protein FliR [Mycobacteriales bacterium]
MSQLLSSAPLSVTGKDVTAFLLVLARTASWSVSSPLLSMRSLPSFSRLALALPLTIFLVGPVAAGPVPAALPSVVTALAVQIAVGLSLGYLTGVLLYAVEGAGHLADLQSGFSFSALVDPITGNDGAVFSRLASFVTVAVLFASGAAEQLVGGFAHSFAALPVGHVPHLNPNGASALGQLLAQTAAATVEIAAPLLGAIFLTDVALALFGRIVPQANVLMVGMSIKALVAVAAVGTLLLLLPGEISGLLGTATRAPTAVFS